MNREEMLKTLQSLHAELAVADSVDSETRQLLRALTDDIHKVLTTHERRPEEAEHQPLSQRLRDTVIDFEIRHPVIGGLLERLTDGLANMGI